ncbi:DUF1771-domain-containing protein [Atractiella rhizophila]|nr:DUF1771-domain-containing protein [Atractiella rhizophila]
MVNIEQIIRAIKKLIKFWRRQQQQQAQQQPETSEYRPPRPPHEYQSSYPPPPGQGAWSHAEGKPPPKDSYQPTGAHGGAAGTGQQPFQGHSTHVGQFHDASPESISKSSSYYTGLRNEAIHESQLMSQCFDDAHAAYESGDGAKAKALSEQGHKHQVRRDEINSRASDWIFHENNKSSPPGTTDLHGLFVQEAVHYTELAVKEGKEKGYPEIRLIVGKGIHSANHVQKIKPAVMELMQKERLRPYPDPHNAGVVIVQLDSDAPSNDFTWARDLDIDGRKSRGSRGPQRDDEDCTIS